MTVHHETWEPQPCGVHHQLPCGLDGECPVPIDYFDADSDSEEICEAYLADR